jgi:hypothetical protein
VQKSLAQQGPTPTAPRGFYPAIVLGGADDRPICAKFHATMRNEDVRGCPSKRIMTRGESEPPAPRPAGPDSIAAPTTQPLLPFATRFGSPPSQPQWAAACQRGFARALRRRRATGDSRRLLRTRSRGSVGTKTKGKENFRVHGAARVPSKLLILLLSPSSPSWGQRTISPIRSWFYSLKFDRIVPMPAWTD